jgi:hypothetical protein
MSNNAIILLLVLDNMKMTRKEILVTTRRATLHFFVNGKLLGPFNGFRFPHK